MTEFRKRSPVNSVAEVVQRNTGMTLRGLETAPVGYIKEAERIAEEIKRIVEEEIPITIVGDYDCDGICASAILSRAIKELGGEPRVRLPLRITEGYGLSEAIVNEIDDGLVITVDNGIAAVDQIKKAKEKGLEVIVTDHHLPGEKLPEADILCDPHLLCAADNPNNFKDYCGAGVALKIAEAMLGKSHPAYRKLCTMAAIATVADLVPLVGDNRRIVKKGMMYSSLPDGLTTGLEALFSAAKVKTPFVAEDIGFRLAPALNACSRVEDSAVPAFEIVSYDGPDRGKAKELAKKLLEVNEKRKEMTKDYLELTGEIKPLAKSPFISIIPAENSFFAGIMGLVASAAEEKYHTAAFIFADEGGNEIRGSARAPEGWHIKNLLDDIEKAEPGILVRYGGHAKAAGLTIKKRNAERFAYLAEKLSAKYHIDTTVYYDIELRHGELKKNIRELKKFEPFGEGNPMPVFYMNNIDVANFSFMGKGKTHLKIPFPNEDIILFNEAQEMAAQGLKKIKCVGVISENKFRGKTTVQFLIKHWKKC